MTKKEKQRNQTIKVKIISLIRAKTIMVVNNRQVKTLIKIISQYQMH